MSPSLPALRVGGLYPAQVERLMADGRIRLRIAGGSVTARAELPVREGQSLIVEVLRLVPEVVLRVHAGGKNLPVG